MAAINERMARQVDYLLEEVRVLREVYTEATARNRIPFTVQCAYSYWTSVKSRARSHILTSSTAPLKNMSLSGPRDPR